MNLDQFKLWLYKASDAEIADAMVEIRGKLKRARNASVILGYQLALEEIAIQQEMRAKYPITPEIEAMSLEDIFAELDIEIEKI